RYLKSEEYLFKIHQKPFPRMRLSTTSSGMGTPRSTPNAITKSAVSPTERMIVTFHDSLAIQRSHTKVSARHDSVRPTIVNATMNAAMSANPTTITHVRLVNGSYADESFSVTSVTRAAMPI